MLQSHNPYFELFPTSNDRTAWQAFGLPAILIAPFALDEAGRTTAGGQILSVKIFIDTETSRTPVSGPTHVIRDANGRNIGVHKPDQNLFVIEFNQTEVVERTIPLDDITVDSDDQFEYTTRTGVTSKLDYSSRANYFDFSDIAIETETLEAGHYDIVYEVEYYDRNISEVSGELLCVNTADERASRFSLEMNHPGEVLKAMVDITPAVYMTSAKRSDDTTIKFYRPFTDILQDVHDEQNFLEDISWIYNIQTEYIPYLSYILGWDLPNFPPTSAETIHKIMLQNVVRLQQLKGTKRAIRELLDLFSTIVNITNVWWTPDGTEFVGVNETASDGTSVTAKEIVTTEPILYEYAIDGFGNISVPLINRPFEWRYDKTKSVTYRAILVEKDTAAYDAAQAISTEIGAYDYEITNSYTDPELATTNDSSDQPIEELMAMSSAQGVAGTSTLVVDDLGKSELTSASNAPIAQLEFDYETNASAFNFAQDMTFEDDSTELFVYATYVYYQITVPTSIVDLQSNRFDISLFGDDGGNINLGALPFMVEYLFKIKAFHSLLRKIIYTFSINDVYQVTDFCVGGDLQQRADTDAGKQQVPPEAIIPETPTSCLRDPEDLGYRAWDIDYRQVILDNLEAEFEAWKARGAGCTENWRGQDRTQQARTQVRRITDEGILHTDGTRSTLCDLNNDDYCYRGRVEDESVTTHIVPNPETWRFETDCILKMGVGTYYTYGIGDSTNIYYTNKDRFDNNNNKANYLAVQKPSLGIQKSNLSVSEHRLPTMNKLEDDFVSLELKLKPWDYTFMCGCPIPDAYDLNARLVTVGEDEYLVFDDEQYSVDGNGLMPDIPSLGDHELSTASEFTADDVVHTIYSTAPAGHPAIEIESIEEVGSGPDIVTIPESLFDSSTQCGSEIEDYVDGYPASVGYMNPPTPILADNVYACDFSGDIYMQTEGVGDFIALDQPTKPWEAMTATSDGSVYACIQNASFYVQTGGVDNFVNQDQTDRLWNGMTTAPNGNIYACVNGGDIYMQTGGTGDFIALSQTNRNWRGMAAAPNGDVYANEFGGGGGGDIYMQTGGTGDFVALSQTSRNWQGMTAAPNGDIYATVYGGDIYMQTGGTGDFNALSQTNRDWTDITIASNGNVYATDYAGFGVGDIYMQTGGTGDFIALGQTSRDWRGIVAAPNFGNPSSNDSDVYAAVFDGGIYMQTSGTGDFITLGQTTRDWSAIAAAPNGNIYATDYAGAGVGDIYMQTGGTGDFITLGQTSRDWYGVAAAPNGNIYACEHGGDIYMQTGGIGDFIALSQTTRNWYGMIAAPNGNVYACVNSGDVYMQTGGTGDFIALSQTTRVWWEMAADPNGDIYASASGNDIYIQTGGTGDFIALGLTSRNWKGLTITNGNIYASVASGDIYKQTDGIGDFVALHQSVGTKTYGSLTSVPDVDILQYDDAYIYSPTDYFPASNPGSSETLESLLGIPGLGSEDFNPLFLLQSFIRDLNSIYAGYRLDCGCLSIQCDITTQEMLSCSIEDFLDNGVYDFNPDKLVVSPAMSLNEIINTDLFLLDATDRILFELKQLNGEVSENGYPATNPYPDTGNFTYKDAYGVLYKISWEVHGEFFDIVTVISDPRVPGVSSNTGRVVGHEIYRTGLITTIRTVLRYTSGTWTTEAQGATQVVGEFQSTYVCSDPFTNPFVYHQNHNLADSFSYSLDGGHSFTTDGKSEASVTHEESEPVLEYLFGTGS